LTGSSNPSSFEFINKFFLRRLRSAGLSQFLERIGRGGAKKNPRAVGKRENSRARTLAAVGSAGGSADNTAPENRTYASEPSFGMAASNFPTATTKFSR